jgi:N-glycosylase/DNA lyase
VKVLVEEIKRLKQGDIGRQVNERIGEFERMGNASEDMLFCELCFCILTANFTAERAIMIQKQMGDGFITLSQARLAKRLKSLGYRFPNTRAAYIVKARAHRGNIGPTLNRLSGKELRDWFACNVLGLGYKEASHFLRNVGYKDFAILDFHIIDLMVENGLIKRPKTLTPRRYLTVEGELLSLGTLIGMNMAELDLYLWYIETGKILK